MIFRNVWNYLPKDTVLTAQKTWILEQRGCHSLHCRIGKITLGKYFNYRETLLYKYKYLPNGDSVELEKKPYLHNATWRTTNSWNFEGKKKKIFI